MSISSQYAQFEAKTTSYTLLVSDDVVNFVIAVPRTATLPLANLCTRYPDGKFRKMIVNASTSSDVLTIAVPSGNTLVGPSTLGIGGTALLTSDEKTIWYMVGGSGVSGVSGLSGASGKSGTSGYSGTSGFSGSSGTSGVSGTSGKSGTSGVSGTSGISGTSGKSGTSGVSGASGTSGTSGTSGF